MSSGKSCAEVTVVLGTDMMIGVARPTVDVNAPSSWMAATFWGWHGRHGKLCHTGGSHGWSQGYATGDVLRLLLDSDAGTLTAKKNGTLLGVMVTQDLTGDLCWAVSSYVRGESVRIKAVDPADF